MLDVVYIVDQLAAHGLIRTKKVVNNYYQCFCPIHNHGQERKPSFGIAIHEEIRNGQKYPQGFCHCFACGYKGPLTQLITDILKENSISKTGMDWLVENIPGFLPGETSFDFLIPEDLMKDLSAEYAVQQIQRLTQPQQSFVPESELQKYRVIVDYMYQRRLTDELIERYDIGVDLNYQPEGWKNIIPCITFPVRDVNGNVLYICRRSIEGKNFFIPKDVPKYVYGIYELPKDAKSVVICESFFNALTAVRYGYPAVALYGTGNALQIDQLRKLGVSEYVICMDGDDAGRRATAKLKKALRDVAIIWAIHMPDGKDANDCDDATFRSLYDAKE
jgi:DNA primase